MMDMWLAGEALAMWEAQASEKGSTGRKLRRPQHIPEEEEKMLSERVINSILSLTRQGLPGKACKMLVSCGIAEWNRATAAAVQRLFPVGNPGAVPQLQGEDEVFTEEEVALSVKRMGRGKAAGPSGLDRKSVV